MPAVQSTYATGIVQTGKPGQVATAYPYEPVLSRECEDAAGIAFGLPVIQGTGDHQAKVATGGSFLGITVQDNTIPASNSEKYVQYDTMAIMRKGCVWVTAGEAVVAGDVVYRTAAGVLNKTSTSNFLIANARWETTAANGQPAIIRLD